MTAAEDDLNVYSLPHPPDQVIDEPSLFQSLLGILPVLIHAVALAFWPATARSVETADTPALDRRGLVDAALSQVQKEAQENSVGLENMMKDDTTALHCDPTRLQQSLGNLLSNAVRFTPSGGTVQITASYDESGGLTLAIRDNGIGIAEKDLSRIMEPFQQVDSGLNRKYEGVGLGIPLARAIVRLHGGDIDYTSELEKGTTARLKLPVECILPTDSSNQSTQDDNNMASSKTTKNHSPIPPEAQTARRMVG